MSRILYGVCGEGNGHSSRTRFTVPFLEKELGHEVKIATHGNGITNLSRDFDVIKISGMRLRSNKNGINPALTILGNLKNFHKGMASVRTLWREIKQFNPHCIITDFEATSAYLANLFRLPLIALDNHHRMRFMKYPCPAKYKMDSVLLEMLIRTTVPNPTITLTNTFYFGEILSKKCYLVSPIVRNEILNQNPIDGNNIVVYITEYGLQKYRGLLDHLKQLSQEQFIIYGFDKEETQENLHFKKFSVTGIAKDLAESKAVIGTAGFMLMTEAMYLKKPMLSLPTPGQFEQIVNGILVNDLGYGLAVFDEIDTNTITYFLNNLIGYRENLERYPRDGNKKISELLASFTNQNCKLLREVGKY